MSAVWTVRSRHSLHSLVTTWRCDICNIREYSPAFISTDETAHYHAWKTAMHAIILFNKPAACIRPESPGIRRPSAYLRAVTGRVARRASREDSQLTNGSSSLDSRCASIVRPAPPAGSTSVRTHGGTANSPRILPCSSTPRRQPHKCEPVRPLLRALPDHEQARVVLLRPELELARVLGRPHGVLRERSRSRRPA